MTMLNRFDQEFPRHAVFVQTRRLFAAAKECDALAPGDNDEPFRKTRHVTNVSQSLKQFQTDLLENFICIALLWTKHSSHRINQPLIAVNQLRPCGLVSVETRAHQFRIPDLIAQQRHEDLLDLLYVFQRTKSARMGQREL